MVVSTGLPNAVVTGLVTGSIVAMGAIGLALVYSIAEVPNFAHGELLTLGAFMALFANRPGTVPVFELLVPTGQQLSTGGQVVLFLIAAGSVLGMVYMLGGWSALAGGWWPVDPPDTVGVGTHLLLAILVGALVVGGAPSIWSGILVATVIVGVVAPVTERVIFRKFRARNATLATMLIVALGLSLILRFGIQAIYGGASRTYAVPRTAELAAGTLYLTAAKFADLYLTGSALVFQLRDSGPPAPQGFNSVPVLTVEWSWVFVAIVLIGTVLAAAGAARWRRRAAEGYVAAQTFGPRIVGSVAGLGIFVVLAVLLAGSAAVPDGYAYGTRIRLFPLKLLIVIIAVAMMATLHLLLRETKLGTAMRASSDNLDLAKVTGINTDRVMMATWVIAGLFAGLSGVMLGLTLSRVQVNIGFFLLLPMFAAVILGGIRSIYGVIVGSFVVGLAMDVGFTVLPVGNEFRVPIAFAVLFVVLLVKPEGIVGGS